MLSVKFRLLARKGLAAVERLLSVLVAEWGCGFEFWIGKLRERFFKELDRSVQQQNGDSA